MRYKPDHKKETRRRIVESAGREFRTHGFEGVGIAKLMSVLKLTHGGFYAHFPDKEALVAESSLALLDETGEVLVAALKTGGFPALLDRYLSGDHRDHPEAGCPLPSLTTELARHSSPSRAAFTAKLQHVYAAIAEYMPGQTQTQKVEKVSVLFASMVGAMTLARAVTDPVFSDSILRTTREHLLSFVQEADSPP